MVQKSYKYRIYPTKEQEQLLAQNFGGARLVYNSMLYQKQKHYEATKESLNIKVTDLKKEYPFLSDCDSLALANASQNLRRSYSNFFNKVSKFPTYKKKSHKQSYTTNNQKCSVRIEGKTIKLPKIGFVKVKLHRQPLGEIKSVTVTKETTGKYYVSILSVVEHKPYPKINSCVGLDLGLKDFYVDSFGNKAPVLDLTKYHSKLKREQRKLSRKREVAKRLGKSLADSKNYQKQRVKVAKLYEKIANSRKDYLHKLSSDLVKNHDLIGIEDLAVSNMMKNHKLARSIGNAAWNTFVSFLSYKSNWYEKELVKINRWFPSTKLCSDCKFPTGPTSLKIRTWICSNCGSEHDRDHNAAINILDESMRLAY